MTTSSDLTVPLLGGESPFLWRRLHSLTGILFGGYLCVHLLINATIAQGASVYQNQVNKIHDLPFLPLIEWTFIYIPILYHTFYGIWITLTGQPNVNNYPFAKNWFYLSQRISAGIMMLFIVFHVLALKYGLLGDKLSFESHDALATIGRHFHTSAFLTYVCYPIGIAAGCFHLANGFWTGAITWGLTISAGSQRRFGLVCIGIFVATFLAGMTAVIASAHLPMLPVK